jgi:hypothetical protein
MPTIIGSCDPRALPPERAPDFAAAGAFGTKRHSGPEQCLRPRQAEHRKLRQQNGLSRRGQRQIGEALSQPGIDNHHVIDFPQGFDGRLLLPPVRAFVFPRIHAQHLHRLPGSQLVG